MKRILIWDLPTRLFHWLFTLGFLAAFVIATTSGEHSSLFVLHMVLGLLVGALAIWRIFWGFWGSKYSRFSALPLSPRALVDYFKGAFSRSGERHTGHNPASAYAMLAMLVLAVGLAVSGLKMAGGGKSLGELHEFMAFSLLATAAVHLTGVIWHQVRHKDGIGLAMVDGKKTGESEAAITSSRPIAGFSLLLLVGACAVLLLSGYDSSQKKLALPGLGVTIAAGDSERDEESDHHRGHKRSRHKDRDDHRDHRDHRDHGDRDDD